MQIELEQSNIKFNYILGKDYINNKKEVITLLMNLNCGSIENNSLDLQKVTIDINDINNSIIEDIQKEEFFNIIDKFYNDKIILNIICPQYFGEPICKKLSDLVQISDGGTIGLYINISYLEQETYILDNISIFIFSNKENDYLDATIKTNIINY